MVDKSSRLEALSSRIQAQNGTVLEKVEGEVEVNDLDGDNRPKIGPVLVLQGIDEGACLRLAQPRAVTVLGHLSGQVFGAYRVKTGTLLSGRLEGTRHVEVIYDMGSKGTSNVDSWIVFEAASDPGFFARVQAELQRWQYLKEQQASGENSASLELLKRSLKTVPYDMRLSVPAAGESRQVFAFNPNRQKDPVQANLQLFLRYILTEVEAQCTDGAPKDKVNFFKEHLQQTILQGLYQANMGGVGAALRQKRGVEPFEPFAEALYEYLEPQMLRLWLGFETRLLQRTVEMLGETPMVLKVNGQLSPFFQIEYPHHQFYIEDGQVISEKVADCNIAGQVGTCKDSMRLTYNYVGEKWVSQTRELPLDQVKDCSLSFVQGHVYLNESDTALFGPDVDVPEEQNA